MEDGAIAGIDSEGGKAKTDPGLLVTSGLGGLGLEGIVGIEDSDGEMIWKKIKEVLKE